MKRISLLSRKGGVGKTLCSMAIAQVLSSKGSTALLDLDPEGSAKAWAGNAESKGVALPYPVFNAVEAAGMQPVQYLVIDTPPNDPKILGTTAKGSDIILIPLQPGAQEADRLESTMDILRQGNFKPGAKFGILLNMLEHDNLSGAMPEVLEKLGYPLVGTIRKSVEYRRAFGGLIPYVLLEPFRQALKEVGVHG